MRKSLVILSICVSVAGVLSSQSVLAADDEVKPAQTTEIKPTIAVGDAQAGEAASALCAGCHGVEGISELPENPSLAGQGAPYIYKQLTEFKSGARVNGVMQGMVAGLSDDDMQNLAAYYAQLPAAEAVSQAENLDLGRQIYQGGITSIQVPACAACHAPDGAGNDAAKFPRLGGQRSDYVALALKNFRSGARANDAGEMMRMVAKRMSDEEIDAVANYVQGLH